MNFKDIYSQVILEHYHYSPHKGVLENAHAQSGVHNPSCGDSVSIQILFQKSMHKSTQHSAGDDTIMSAKFQAQGCVISGAAASLLLEKIIGMSIDVCMNLDRESMLEVIKIPLGPTRLRCALLALEAVHKALGDYVHAQKKVQERVQE